MIKLDEILPKGALLEALETSQHLPMTARTAQTTQANLPSHPSGDLQNHTQNSKDTDVQNLPKKISFRADKGHFAKISDTRVLSWNSDFIPKQAIAVKANETGANFDETLQALVFENKQNHGFLASKIIKNVENVIIDLDIWLFESAEPRTLFTLNLNAAKQYVSLWLDRKGFALFEKNAESHFTPPSPETNAPLSLHLIFSGRDVTLKIGDHEETLKIEAERWDGSADLFIGCRNHNPGPIGIHGHFGLLGMTINNAPGDDDEL